MPLPSDFASPASTAAAPQRSWAACLWQQAHQRLGLWLLRRLGQGDATLPRGVSPQQERRDTQVLCAVAYGLYALYMAVPVANLIVVCLAAAALALGVRHHGGGWAAWRAWTIAEGFALVGVLVPLLAQRAGLCHGHGLNDLTWRVMGKAWSVIWALLGARTAVRHVPAACRWAVRAQPHPVVARTTSCASTVSVPSAMERA